MADEPDPIDIAVGARVRILRKRLGVSQAMLAEALGLTFQQVQKYERGTNRIAASTLVRIAQRLETTVANLLGEDEPGIFAGEVARQLAETGSLQLVAAYANIPDRAMRRALVQLTETLGHASISAKSS